MIDSNKKTITKAYQNSSDSITQEMQGLGLKMISNLAESQISLSTTPKLSQRDSKSVKKVDIKKEYSNRIMADERINLVVTGIFKVY
jgi:mannose/fructose/N-acetylgalactosamine-specific phosphotransferase system component IID